MLGIAETGRERPRSGGAILSRGRHSLDLSIQELEDGRDVGEGAAIVGRLYVSKRAFAGGDRPARLEVKIIYPRRKS